MRATRGLVCAVTLTLLFLAGAAFADSIDFSYTGNNPSSTWSWGGGSATLSASANTASLGLVGGSSSPLLGNVLISFTSGPGTGGAGTLADPYTFGPSAAGSIIVNGCLPGSGSGCSTVNLFTGQFLEGEVAFVGGGNFDFDGIDVTGTLNAAVASYFGFNTDNVVGGLDGILVCSGGFFDGCMGSFNGLVGSGDLVLSPGPNGPPVPEPSTMFFMGSGLLGLVAYFRRRRVSA